MYTNEGCLPGYQIVGTCSLCGGPVTVLTTSWSVVAPTPVCSRCGATKKEDFGPVIEMEPKKYTVSSWPSTNTIPCTTWIGGGSIGVGTMTANSINTKGE